MNFFALKDRKTFWELMERFKGILHKKVDDSSASELVVQIDRLSNDKRKEIDNCNFGRLMSALIATASFCLDPTLVHSFQLDLPHTTKNDLKNELLPFLKAIQHGGYQDHRKRKAFVVGNTGNIFVY